MRIVRLDPSDQVATQACHEVVRAVLAADDPSGPPVSARSMRAWLKHPDQPGQAWFACEQEGDGAAGWYHLTLPAPENRDGAMLVLDVHPSLRRRGIGSALLRHAARRASLDGRSVLACYALAGTAGAAFSLRAGATPGLLDARRVQVLGEVPPGRIASLRAEAARAATGYSLVPWLGRTPDEYLAGYAGVRNALKDAPRNPGREARRWDARRIREQVDDVRELRGRHIYTIAALHDATGEMAAVTEVETDRETPEWGHQLITAVTRPHRGHRLGLLVKTAMMDWLAEAEPALERIVTGNAAVNRHMIAINESLGYELLGPQAQNYELSVADALAFGATG